MKTKASVPPGRPGPRASFVLCSRCLKSFSRTLLAALIPFLFVGRDARGADTEIPPVTFSAEPEEDGKLVYLPIVAPTSTSAPSHLFGLELSMMNNAINDVELTLIRLTFTYADNAVFAIQFLRDVVIPAGVSTNDYLSPDDPKESVQLPDPPPVSVQIDLFFDGYRLPRTVQRQLARYAGPGAGVKYLFPANEADLGSEDYFSHVDPHTGGSQFFGYDFHVRRWNGQTFSSEKAGTDGSANEHAVGWGVPIYAMADGVVLSADADREDNPAPGERAIQRMDDESGASVSDVKATRLSAGRVVTVARQSSGLLGLNVWDLLNEGRIIAPNGSASGEAVTEIATDALKSSRLVTAVRLASGILRMILWDVSSDGTTVIRRGERDASAVKEVSVIRVSNSRFATAARLQNDSLELALWDVSDDGFTLSAVDRASAGVASSISVVALSASRLATSLRDSNGQLKVIVWDIAEDGSLVRRGDATGDDITKALSVAVSGTQLATSMRTAAGNLKVAQWLVSEDGETVSPERSKVAGLIQDLAEPIVLSESMVMTAVATEEGNYKNILWRQPDDGEDATLFYRRGEAEAGAVSRLSVDAADGTVFFSGVRDSAGDLKVISWWMGSGGGNNVVILHGNCYVLYAHFRAGSVSSAVANPGARVSAGQYLGRMGNSGSSSGPHTHIHATRVSSLLSVEEILALNSTDALSFIGFRPIPFHCGRAIRLSALQPGGVGNRANNFSNLNGHGVYFEPFAIGPRWLQDAYVDPTIACGTAFGRKLCTPISPTINEGPFTTVGQSLNTICWSGTLHVHGGSYNESVTFNRTMIVRSYDGTAVIGQ